MHLKTGFTCPLSQSSCLDETGGYIYWDTLPKDICQFNKYQLLYDEITNKIQDDSKPLFSLTTDEATFVLAQKEQTSLCNYILIRTEHAKLFLFETKPGQIFLQKNKPSVQSMGIFTYVNSKFIYVERHIRTEMTRLYRDVMLQRCTLEQEGFKNTLTLETQAPDEFAF